MTPERHLQIGRIYHDALELPPHERRAFLDQACTGDAGLRKEVEELLSAHELATSFIEAPALLQTPEFLEKRAAPEALTDKVVSHYRVLDKIGEGGMGVVYRAEDLQLRRQVALKFLPGGLAAEQGLRGRLMREARTAAAPNHPNICTVFEVDQTESGTPFIAMELVRGIQ